MTTLSDASNLSGGFWSYERPMKLKIHIELIEECSEPVRRFYLRCTSCQDPSDPWTHVNSSLTFTGRHGIIQKAVEHAWFTHRIRL